MVVMDKLPVDVDLTKIDIEGEVGDNKVMLTDDVGVTLRVPNFNEVQNIVSDLDYNRNSKYI